MWCWILIMKTFSHFSTEQALPDDWEYTGADVAQVHSTAHNNISQGNDWRKHYVSTLYFEILLPLCFVVAILLYKWLKLIDVMQNVQSRTHQIGARLFDLPGSNGVRRTAWTWIFRCVYIGRRRRREGEREREREEWVWVSERRWRRGLCRIT